MCSDITSSLFTAKIAKPYEQCRNEAASKALHIKLHLFQTELYFFFGLSYALFI